MEKAAAEILELRFCKNSKLIKPHQPQVGNSFSFEICKNSKVINHRRKPALCLSVFIQLLIMIPKGLYCMKRLKIFSQVYREYFRLQDRIKYSV